VTVGMDLAWSYVGGWYVPMCTAEIYVTVDSIKYWMLHSIALMAKLCHRK